MSQNSPCTQQPSRISICTAPANKQSMYSTAISYKNLYCSCKQTVHVLNSRLLQELVLLLQTNSPCTQQPSLTRTCTAPANKQSMYSTAISYKNLYCSCKQTVHVLNSRLLQELGLLLQTNSPCTQQPSHTTRTWTAPANKTVHVLNRHLVQAFVLLLQTNSPCTQQPSLTRTCTAPENKTVHVLNSRLLQNVVLLLQTNSPCTQQPSHTRTWTAPANKTVHVLNSRLLQNVVLLLQTNSPCTQQPSHTRTCTAPANKTVHVQYNFL